LNQYPDVSGVAPRQFQPPIGRHLLAGTPAEYGKLVAKETEKWAKVIRDANIKPQ